MEPMQTMVPMMEPMEPAPVHSACQCVKKHLSQMKTTRKQKRERGGEKDAGLNHKTLQYSEGISTSMSRGASAMGSADLGRHQEAEGEAEGIESGQ